VVGALGRYAPGELTKLIHRFSDCPFVIAELAGRIGFGEDMDLHKLADRATVRLLSDALVALRVVEADFAPRMAILTLLFKLVKQKPDASGYMVLSESFFVNAFLRFLYERGLTDAILQTLKQAFSNLHQGATEVSGQKRLRLTEVLGHSMQFLLTFIRRVPEMTGTVYSFIVETVSVCPSISSAVLDFLEVFMDELEEHMTAASFGNAIVVLGAAVGLRGSSSSRGRTIRSGGRRTDARGA